MNKLQVAVHLIKVNGPAWFTFYSLEKITKGITSVFYKRRIHYETKNQLPGFNSIAYNYKEWSNYNWNNEGEEWSASQSWKSGLINEVMNRYIQNGKTILEIGPGGGRWSESLAQRSSKLILVDLTEKSIEVCKNKLKSYTHCSFYKNNGTDLSFLPASSIDYLWSFDVFVHIAPRDIESYLKEFGRIFKSGAIGIIHHSINGTHSEGFRSSLTNETFLTMLNKYHFKLIRQIKQWGPNNIFSLTENDAITIFNKE
jgi:ubiquinone/menaquinone biosynthesis C-methylase UbiE